MSNWDKILASAPLNMEAAAVTSKGDDSGFRGSFAQNDAHIQDGPHKTRRIPTCDPNFTDLSGRQIGELTIIGLADGFKRSSTGAAWAVRCSCSRYTIRRSKTLLSEDYHTRARCGECDYAERVKQGRAKVKVIPC